MQIKTLLSVIAVATLFIFNTNEVTAQQPIEIAPANTNSNELLEESSHPLDDTLITTKVKAELAITDGIDSNAISVETVNGVVILTGTQPNADLIENTINIVAGIKGVKKVDASGLTVSSPTN